MDISDEELRALCVEWALEAGADFAALRWAANDLFEFIRAGGCPTNGGDNA